MPRLWKPFFLLLCASLPLIAEQAGAQAQPPTTPAKQVAPAQAKADSAKAVAPAQPSPSEEVLVRRHPRPFGVSARGSYLLPVKILKENQRNINDLFKPNTAFDAGVCWYPLDGLRVAARAMRGGLKMTDNAYDLRGHLPPANSPFSVTPPLTPSTFLKMDTVSLSLSAFLGNALFPGSRFNPYLTGMGSRASWKLSVDGRSGAAHEILDVPLEGTNFGVGGGLGTEYDLSGPLMLDFEWTWQYVFTSMDSQFPEWTNTHFWDLSLGLIYTF